MLGDVDGTSEGKSDGTVEGTPLPTSTPLGKDVGEGPLPGGKLSDSPKLTGVAVGIDDKSSGS